MVAADAGAQSPDKPRVPIRPSRQNSSHLSPSTLPAFRRRWSRKLREARRDAAPGLSGARPQHFKLLLADAHGLELLAYAASVLAKARAPPTVSAALALASMTALRKPDGGVRGIATGDAFRRLVSRALAKIWAATFDEATRPFQHALSARSGMDALVARLRVALETDPDVTVVSLDGRSAYDRTAFLSKLRPVAPALLPFVRNHRCTAGEELLACLDDLRVITSSARATPALDVVVTRVEEHGGIASNVGKTRIYNTAGCPAPRGVAELGEEVWRSDRPLPERGFTALGVPIGHGDYVREWGHSAACGKSRRCWTICIHLPHLPGLQCAWLLLRTCVSTRANHTLRNIPPEDVRPYAEGHSAKRGLAGMPHLGRTPQHLMRSPVCPGGRAWRLASRLAVVHVLASPGASTLPVSKWRAMARARAANLAFAHEAARGLPPFAAFVGVRSGRRVRAASDSAPGRAISMRGVSMKRVHARVGVMPVPTPSPRPSQLGLHIDVVKVLPSLPA
eukprot:s2223_g15.t1